jgi:hypothetical protein
VTDVQHGVNGQALIAQACHGYRVRGIPREASDGTLIVNDAGGHLSASEAANDSQPLVVTANHDSADWLLRASGRGPACREEICFSDIHTGFSLLI